MSTAATSNRPPRPAADGADRRDDLRPARRRRPRRALRTTRKLAFVLSAIAAAALALALVAPLAAGWRTFTVVSGSMEPTIAVGDAVVVKPILAREARVGDVVTFADPDDRRRLLTHRVARVGERRGALAFVTRGDANTGVERWSIAPGGRMGRLAYRVPKAGYLLAAARTREGRIGLLVLPALLLGALAIVGIWKPSTKAAPDERA